MQPTTAALGALALSLVFAPIAAASPVQGDVEVDPAAYALRGNSIHVGLAYEHLRIDLGNFGMALPQVVHGDDGFDVRFDGYGAKLQWFARDDRRGWFAGVDAAVSRVHVRLQGSDLAATDTQLGTGVHGGYRFTLPASFYVTAWLGVGYVWSADDVMLGGERFEATPVTVFPAIHLGYRFP